MTVTQQNVFVVDDDSDVREAVAAVVGSLGFCPRSYPSAEAFLADYDGSLPGCVVSDVRMTGMSGLELLDKMREADDIPPIILISAYADVPLAVRAMGGGAFTVLEKPCDKAALCQAIRNGIDADRARRTQRTAKHEIARRLETLTAGERAVAELVMKGKLNKVIAMDLDISLRTVEMRRHAVFAKLGVDSVAELVRLVLEGSPPPTRRAIFSEA